MSHQTAILALCLLLNCAPLAAQQIYKHVDERGKVTYSNEPIKGGKKVDLPPISTVTLPKPAAAAKSETAPASEADKAQRKKQLQEAIAAEEKALESAKSKQSDAATVTQHEKKLAELKAELGRLDAKP